MSLSQPSEIRWASRWDTYLKMTDDRIHWFSIINSVMIVLFLSGMVAMIMIRTLWRDIAKYNQLDDQEEAAEESGWKLVHGDVFRPPEHASLLATYAGVGVQLFGMLVITTVFALFGFLSPANRGGLMTAMVLMFVFMGVLAGYSAARLYKSFRGEQWKEMTTRTALMFPGILFAVFFVLDLLVWGQKSSGAVPFGTLVAICFLWFGVSVPLVFVGSYYGFKKPADEDPVRTNKIPRQVPEQPWYMHPAFACFVGGVLPFGAVFIELYFILTSVWLHQFYYLFGFLALVFVILIITCAEITIVLCYFQLCAEDYNWWWRAYLTSGSSALYLWVYSAFYFYTKLDITKVSERCMCGSGDCFARVNMLRQLGFMPVKVSMTLRLSRS
jgi:transmembrane 9 superfamily protein 2/4